MVERAAPAMMVVDASTLAVVAGWPASKPAVPHWYQLGETRGARASRRSPRCTARARRPPAADVAPDDAFAVISTAAVDVVPRGAALTHANVLAANLTTIGRLRAAPRPIAIWLALPLFHITALGMALAHMHAGGASVVVPRFDADGGGAR